MQLLAGTAYNPATLQTFATTAAGAAMTAFDTTNLRLTFTAPTNGSVLVRQRVPVGGSATAFPQVLLGILEGATVRARTAPYSVARQNSASQLPALDSFFVVTGLTPGQSYTWDAAYGIETGVASTSMQFGGPDDAVASNAYGAYEYEIWTAERLLQGVNYDPAVSAAFLGSTANRKMTALDTTNLRLTFTAPGSGNVQVTMRYPMHGATSTGLQLLGILDGTTIRARVKANQGAINSPPLATDIQVLTGNVVVTGLTPGASYTWDAAIGIENSATNFNIKAGGPDNATGNDAFGGLGYYIWNVDDVPLPGQNTFDPNVAYRKGRKRRLSV